MLKILVWGTGKRCKEFLQEIDYHRCSIIAFIETNPDKGDTGIICPDQIDQYQYDFIVVTPDKPEKIIEQLGKLKIGEH